MEAHQPYSLDAQRERLAAYIRSQPYWVAGPEYCDEFSGARTDRPGLQQALTAAQAGGFDILLVYRVDRLARSLTVLTAVLDSLAVAGVGLRSVTEPIDTSSSVGRLLLQMLGVFAQFEREVIIDRVICGMERKAAVGGWTGGTLPYGYLVDHRAERLLPHTDEAPVVGSIFAAYAAAAYGTRTIATQLNARGLRTRSGRPWTGQAVGRLLSNRTYLGEGPSATSPLPARIHPWSVNRPSTRSSTSSPSARGTGRALRQAPATTCSAVSSSAPRAAPITSARRRTDGTTGTATTPARPGAEAARAAAPAHGYAPTPSKV
jgi:site-specific DNA recombinase